MSFSTTVKDELAKIPVTDKDELHAELAAYLRYTSTLRFHQSKVSLILSTEIPSLARRIVYILKELYDARVDVSVVKNHQLKRKSQYRILLEEEHLLQTVCSDSGYVQGYGFFDRSLTMSGAYLRSEEELRAYIRGTFLSVGSVSNPEKGYHLEFPFREEEQALDVQKWLEKAGFSLKCVPRKDYFILYLKEAELISDLLAYMGAGASVLSFESTRVMKDVRGRVNRLVNFETANLSKTVSASYRQMEDIAFLQERVGLDSLPENLAELARLRLENPQASLLELGKLFQPPISKSGINHRFQKIHKLAKDLRGESSERS
ncbi:MAG: DNA-binding protein WhiA [Tissierellia bacterium]|nr:DNA-binding protein WhiA [Tissierellia bacterium]